MNKAIFMGFLGSALELRQNANGTIFATSTVYVYDYTRKDKDGKSVLEATNSIILYGKYAETMSQFADKGRKVLVEGKVQTYTDKDGIKRTSFLVDNMQFLDAPKPKVEAPEPAEYAQVATAPSKPATRSKKQEPATAPAPEAFDPDNPFNQ